MRWVNNHVYFMKARSPLGLRVLNTVAGLPFEDSTAWRQNIIRDVCRTVGYRPVTDPVKFRDVYNVCVLQLVMAAEENYRDEIDDILYDHPLVIVTRT